MSPIQIALLLLAVAGVWAIVELALTLRKTRTGCRLARQDGNRPQ